MTLDESAGIEWRDNPMSQKQFLVNLVLLNDERRKAVATGNNAAWSCQCDRVMPLIGRSGSKAGPSQGSAVECPDCGRRYFVAPKDKNRGRVFEVKEIE